MRKRYICIRSSEPFSKLIEHTRQTVPLPPGQRGAGFMLPSPVEVADQQAIAPAAWKAKTCQRRHLLALRGVHGRSRAAELGEPWAGFVKGCAGSRCERTFIGLAGIAYFLDTLLALQGNTVTLGAIRFLGDFQHGMSPAQLPV